MSPARNSSKHCARPASWCSGKKAATSRWRKRMPQVIGERSCLWHRELARGTLHDILAWDWSLSAGREKPFQFAPLVSIVSSDPTRRQYERAKKDVLETSRPLTAIARRGGRVHAPPHWLQAVPPLTTKLSFPAQIRRCQVLNLATRVKNAKTRPRASQDYANGG